MEKRRINNLKMVKAFYVCIDTALILMLILSLLFFKRLNLRFLTLIIIDLGIVIALVLINYEVYVSGIEKVANAGLTRMILSEKKLTIVIPVNPPNDIYLKTKGTYNYLYGDIHKDLVKLKDKEEYYAKLSSYGETVQISKKYKEQPGITYVGSISPEDFPFYYDLSKD